MSYPAQSERPDLSAIMNEEIASVKATVKSGERVLCALSGGVDSAVVASMLHRAIGDRLVCVFVDHGGMRLGEADEIRQRFSAQFGPSFIAVDAGAEYLKDVRGVTDSEVLRKIIGQKFIDVFKQAVGKFDNIKYFAQGTILTDLNESGADGKKHIKTHHNVGIDEFVKEKGWALVEPLKRLRKQDVRTVGSWLDIPDAHLNRQPFPGPGNYLRVIGGDITAQDLKMVAQFDATVRKHIDAANLPDAKQYFGAMVKNARYAADAPEYIPQARKIVKSVTSAASYFWNDIKITPGIKVTGIRNNERAEEPIMIINNNIIQIGNVNARLAPDRALYEIQREISDRICAELPVGRVMYAWDMPADYSDYNFIVRSVDTINFDEAVPTYLGTNRQIKLMCEYGRNRTILFDMTRKPSATIEYR